jgi:tripartite ATP-independent transporter DctP family solute receptor
MLDRGWFHRGWFAVACLALAAAPPPASAADARHFTLAYDQPHNTGLGVAADMFADELAELSHNTLIVDRFPGAQLGQDPAVMQKVRTGDVDFSISATANLATLSPQSGVLSIHYLFRDEDHLTRAIADPALLAAVQAMFDETVQGGHVMTLVTLGLRNLYGKKEIHRVEDLRGQKVRVQATATEDALFPAYGAQTVHMPFGSVYTSLQTGVVDMAENGINVYQSNRHYEVAPVMSATEHEANILTIWMSDKTLTSLTPEQQGWVRKAAADTGHRQPARAIEMEHASRAQLQKLGVRFVTDVDKSGFMALASPLQDKLAEGLGPHAVKILALCRAIQ